MHRRHGHVLGKRVERELLLLLLILLLCLVLVSNHRLITTARTAIHGDELVRRDGLRCPPQKGGLLLVNRVLWRLLLLLRLHGDAILRRMVGVIQPEALTVVHFGCTKAW